MQYYKDKGKIFFQVGLITAISLLILFFSYGWITRAFVDSKYEKIKVAFASAGGLARGAEVCVQGVPSGYVDDVQITRQGVLFELKVELPFALREGTAFVVEDIDLMGNKQLNIIPSVTGKELDLQKIYYGEVKITFNRFIMRLNKILDDMDEGGVDFAKVSKIIDNLDAVVSQSQQALMQFSKKKGLLDQSQQALLQVNSLLQKLNNENTSMGKFLQDTILYEQIVTSTKRVDSLLIDVKANPTKYFKIEVF